MDKIIKNILVKIESEGFEAYVVGGYVRDFILGINSYDIDICTNALPKDLYKLFPKNNNSNNYGGFNIKIKKYNVDITTYRKEIKYDNRKPIEIEYINNLLEDLKRRDFTINSLCMNKKGEIIDLLHAREDIDAHLIKMIGDSLIKTKEDPLRILRAIRFATILDFEIDYELKEIIKANHLLINTLSSDRIKEEISKILLSKNYQKGLDLLKELNIDTDLGLKYNKVKYVSDLLLMWSQIDNNLNFSKNEKITIKKMKEIIKYGRIDNNILFKYGLYLSTAVGEYLGLSKKDINKLYKELPIKDENDLAIKTKDIMTLLKIGPSEDLGKIKTELIDLILNKKLKNNNKIIKNYLRNR